MRLMPALQQIYASLTKIGLGRPGLDALYADLIESGDAKPQQVANDPAPLHLRSRLELRNIRYTYPKARAAALIDVSLTIQARTTVGFVGATGAGKTTVVDVILGLLEADQGEVLVDGVAVSQENVRAWQRSIGYVPQHIFLTDDTVTANIAFGVPPQKVDVKAVERAAQFAELHDFVTQELPRGYETFVGERGIRLSGGQRQRVGIARALYHDPDVLVMDEATSALDNLTERAVMDAIHNLARRKTIILIAHRLSTVRSCDRIFLMERGRIKASGAYDELLRVDEGFRRMAAV
jgi:ABC-type multidrug transport system fused ATPase/permease subunit